MKQLLSHMIDEINITINNGMFRSTKQSEGQLYPPPQNDNGAVSKFKA